MNKSTILTVIVILVMIGSMGAVIVYDQGLNENNDEETTYNIVSRINNEGSGIYIEKSIKDDRAERGLEFFNVETDGSYTVSEENKEAWGGLVVGTPGSASIQHVQMHDLAVAMGLKFSLYKEGVSLNSDSLYYATGMSNATTVLNTDIPIDGGILWECQYSAIVDGEGKNGKDFEELGLTNNFFPGHACCTVNGNTSFMNSHPDVAERFLAGFMKGVDWINAAKADKSSDEYALLVEICMEKTGNNFEESVVESAIDNITYVYGDGEDRNNLNDLKADIANLSTTLPGLNRTIYDNGFINGTQFANRFVDDSFLFSAKEKYIDGGETYTGMKTTVTVSCITGDLHQMGLHMAKHLGFFDDYGINVQISNAVNGSGVATSMQNGDSEFGFMGAPPATSTVINGNLVAN